MAAIRVRPTREWANISTPAGLSTNTWYAVQCVGPAAVEIYDADAAVTDTSAIPGGLILVPFQNTGAGDSSREFKWGHSLWARSLRRDESELAITEAT